MSRSVPSWSYPPCWLTVTGNARLPFTFWTLGFELVKGEPSSNFVLRDGRGREIDVHPARIDADGNDIYRMGNGEDCARATSDLARIGRIGDRAVRCVTADAQMFSHATGYVPDETDHRDTRSLNARLGTPLLAPFDSARR